MARARGSGTATDCADRMLRSRGVDMPKIVSSFTTDTGLNDVLVHGFVCRSCGVGK